MFAAAMAMAAGIVPADSTAIQDPPLVSATASDSPEMLWGIARSMGFAFVVGTALALHPLRSPRGGRSRGQKRMVQAQILLTVAAALMVVVIDGRAERALGLVGLGSFIRFRNVVSNPIDTALIFVHIGLGMACGSSSFALAGVGAAVFLVVLVPILLYGRRDEDRAEVVSAAEILVQLDIRGPDGVSIAQIVRRHTEEVAGARLVSARESAQRFQASVLLPRSTAVMDWTDALRAQFGDGVDAFRWRCPEEES